MSHYLTLISHVKANYLASLPKAGLADYHMSVVRLARESRVTHTAYRYRNSKSFVQYSVCCCPCLDLDLSSVDCCSCYYNLLQLSITSIPVCLAQR